MKDVNLNSLKIFLVVATSNSFLEASNKLYISQPAISKSINKFYNQYGSLILNLENLENMKSITGKNNKELILDKEAGDNTIEAIRKYQVSRNGACGRTDGIADEKTLKDMIAL